MSLPIPSVIESPNGRILQGSSLGQGSKLSSPLDSPAVEVSALEVDEPLSADVVPADMASVGMVSVDAAVDAAVDDAVDEVSTEPPPPEAPAADEVPVEGGGELPPAGGIGGAGGG